MRGLIAEPVLFVLVLIVLGLVLAARPIVSRQRRRCGITVIAVATALLYGLATPWGASQLLRLVNLPQPALPPLTVRPMPQALVVLAAGIEYRAPEYGGRDTVDAFGLERIRYAARLHRQTGLPILVSGGRLRSDLPAAETMREALAEDFAVPVRWIEGQSTTTEESARLSARLLHADGIERVYLVTHAVHMARAVEAFSRAGIAVVPAPTQFLEPVDIPLPQDLLPASRALYDSYLALHEAIGRAWYRLAYGKPPRPEAAAAW
jgi:uncharacterized SAM-binding protein YcdF (DUF218 family)